jgi:hypothetical protein
MSTDNHKLYLVPNNREELKSLIKESLIELFDDRGDLFQWDPNELVKIDFVMDKFKITRPTVYQWIEKGILPDLKIGGKRFFPKGQLVLKQA